MAENKTQAMPSKDASGTSGEAEESARDAYHGARKAPAGGGDVGRKDPQQSGDSGDGENVRQR